MNISTVTRLQEANINTDTFRIQVIILKPGLSDNGTYYPVEVLRDAASIFAGVKCYADHPSDGENERSVRDIVGEIIESWFDGKFIRGEMVISRSAEWLITMISEGIIGDLSIHALGKTKVTRIDGVLVREVISITKALSVDFVTQAAAGGRVEKILSESAGYAAGLRLIDQLSPDEMISARPDIFEKLKKSIREEILSEANGNFQELEDLREKVERERKALGRELIARECIRGSGLPPRSHEILLAEALSIRVESEDSYADAVRELICRHREYLAGLASDGLIRGMGSGKPENNRSSDKRRETLRLMGISG